MRKRKLLSLALVMAASLTIPALAAVSDHGAVPGAAKDAYGTAAPAIDGVKWWLAPTYWGWVQTSGSNGFALYKTDQGCGMFNPFGKQVLPNQFASVEARENYLVAALTRNSLESNHAIYALDGTKLTEAVYQQDCNYDDISDGTGGKFAGLYTTGHKSELYLNTETKQLLPEMRYCGPFWGGHAGFEALDGRVGYMDTEGTVKYAPTDFVFIRGCGENTLNYIRKSGNSEYEGLCSLDFASIFELDRGKATLDRFLTEGVVYAEKDGFSTGGQVYDLSGALLLDLKKGTLRNPYYNDAGHTCIPFLSDEKQLSADSGTTGIVFSASGKTMVYDTVTKQTAWDARSNLPEGYSVEGVAYIGLKSSKGSLGLRDADGKFVISQSYAGLIPVICGGKNLVIAADSQNNNYLLDIAGKRLAGPYDKIEAPNAGRETNNPAANAAMQNAGFLLAGTEKGTETIRLSVLDSTGKVVESGASSVIFTKDGFASRTYTDETDSTFQDKYYDITGTEILPNVNYFPYDPSFEEGLLLAETTVDGEEKFGLCDSKFNLIVPVVFDRICDATAGQMWVQYQGKWGIIDNPLNDTAETCWK